MYLLGLWTRIDKLLKNRKGGSTKETGTGKVSLVYLTPSAYTPSPSKMGKALEMIDEI